jgi:hypothetical protein
MYEQIIKDATKDLVGNPLDQDVLVERLTQVLMEVIPKPNLGDVQVKSEDGRKYEFVFPLDTSCRRCGCLVREPHRQQWGRFVCSDCGEFVYG